MRTILVLMVVRSQCDLTEVSRTSGSSAAQGVLSGANNKYESGLRVFLLSYAPPNDPLVRCMRSWSVRLAEDV